MPIAGRFIKARPESSYGTGLLVAHAVRGNNASSRILNMDQRRPVSTYRNNARQGGELYIVEADRILRSEGVMIEWDEV